MDDADVPATAFLDRIIARTSGGLSCWVPPADPPQLGPEYSLILQRLKVRISGYSSELRKSLSLQGLDSLADKFDARGNAAEEAAKAWQDEWYRKSDGITRHLTIWDSAGLGAPGMNADYDYWSRMAYFKTTEALWLASGLEPTAKFHDSLTERLRPGYSYTAEVLHMQRREELFKRELDPNGFHLRTNPKELDEWITRVNLEVHPGFASMLKQMLSRTDIDAEPAPESRVSDPLEQGKFENREKTSLAKLLVAIAIKEYGYDPTARRSPIPSEIQGVADSLGLSLSQDTIRRYLQMGARHLPERWKPHED